MPEATALKPNSIKPEHSVAVPKETWVTYNDQGQIDFQKSVQNRLAEAGIKHDPVPIKEQKPRLPVQVPEDGSTHNTIEVRKGSLDVPDTFKTSPNDFGHIMNFTEDGASPRTGDAKDIKNTMKEKEEAVLQARNEPKEEKKGIIVVLDDWFHDRNKKKKAA